MSGKRRQGAALATPESVEPNARERRIALEFAEVALLAPLDRDAMADVLAAYRVELRADFERSQKAVR